jgi:DNA polymerase (family 10)
VSRNAAVADELETLADFLEARGVEYKPQTYRTAAANVRDYPEDVAALAASDSLGEIEGVGDAIAGKIAEFVETGEIGELEAERADLPVEMEALTRVEGVGPKTVRKLYDALGIRSLEELEEAAENDEIREVKGFGAKTEENIAEGIPFARESAERELLGDARPVGEEVREFVRSLDPVTDAELCGSLRRWKPTIGDVDVLAASPDDAAAVEAFADWERADDVIESGTKKASLRIDGLRVDLRVVVPAEYGAALQYFTGSREHNIRLRNHAIGRERKVNEYGVFDVSDVADPDAGQRVGERVAGETEAGVYDALGLPFIEPELREDAGEIDAAKANGLPDLLTEPDVRGDLHTHTDYSDGDNTIAEMVAGAAEFGHDYIAITDHGEGPGVFGNSGLDAEDLRDQRAEIESVAADADIDVFAGVETNVDSEGNVESVPDDALAGLDVVIASPHSALEGDATERLVRAIEHEHVDVLGHPTGRLINSRPGVDMDAERVAAAAAREGVALEVNANPHRLDLTGGHVRTALEAGATVVIDTDAHSPAEFANVTYGVHTARRGWAEAADVLNARDADGVREFLGL